MKDRAALVATDGLVEAQPTEILKNVSSAAKVVS